MISKADAQAIASGTLLPVCERLELDAGPYEKTAATQLLLGTGLQESGFLTRVQVGGPALGWFQMEPDTHDDCWRNFLAYKSFLAQGVTAIAGAPPHSSLLLTSDAYAAAMCRVQYFREAQFRAGLLMPPPGCVSLFADWWKRFWNTRDGAGTEEEFAANFNAVMG